MGHIDRSLDRTWVYQRRMGDTTALPVETIQQQTGAQARKKTFKLTNPRGNPVTTSPLCPSLTHLPGPTPFLPLGNSVCKTNRYPWSLGTLITITSLGEQLQAQKEGKESWVRWIVDIQEFFFPFQAKLWTQYPHFPNKKLNYMVW